MDITIYTSHRCGYCRHLKTLLTRANLEWTEYVIEESISLADFKAQYPNASKTPFVVIDDGNLKRNYDDIVQVAKFLVKEGLVEVPPKKQYDELTEEQKQTIISEHGN